MLNSCTSLNEVQYYNNGMNDLNGTWVVSDKYSSGVQDIVLHVESALEQPSIKLLGHNVVYQSMDKSKDKVLLKFEDGDGQLYYMIGQFNSKNEMRMSFTTEEVTDFLPVGQLGEKVYRLERIENYKEVIVASRN